MSKLAAAPSGQSAGADAVGEKIQLTDWLR